MPSVKELAARIERSSQQREAAAAASLSPPRRRKSLGSPGRLGSPRTPAEALAAAAPLVPRPLRAAFCPPRPRQRASPPSRRHAPATWSKSLHFSKILVDNFGFSADASAALRAELDAEGKKLEHSAVR